MAEFLIQALNETAPLRYWRGDLIEDYDDGRIVESPSPNSGKVLLKVPGLDRATSKSQIADWMRRIQYSVVSSNLSTDTHRLTVSATEYNPNSGIGKVTRDHVENFLNDWNATVVSFGDNSVTFDIVILDAIRSERFWLGIDRTGAIMVEQNYNQNNGNHRVQVDYSVTSLTSEDVESAILHRGGAINSHNVSSKIIIFTIHRSDVRSRFEEDVKTRVETLLARRKYRLTEAAVQAIESAGGLLTIDLATYNTYWKNKLEE